MRFGLPLFAEPIAIVEPTTIELNPGTIVLLLGPSGSGKSSLLGEIKRHRAAAIMVQSVGGGGVAAVVDRVADSAPLAEALTLLSACALGEPRLWVRRFSELSDGERFRAKLARAIGLQLRRRSPGPLLCDEFCSILHRRAAKAIAFNLRKLVSRRGLCLVAASSNDDIVEDLRPDVVVRLRDGGRSSVHNFRRSGEHRFSLRSRVRIERGSRCDYADFSAMHYRTTDELGFVDKVFLLREVGTRATLGIVVYSFAPLELSLRNRATGGLFKRNAKRLNRCLRILRRLVIHPDVRGCGLGHLLVERTLRRVGTPYVECLANMGTVNPVFEKAGMERIGQCPDRPENRRVLARLRAMDVDPNAREFPQQVARRPLVRAIVARVIRDWYAATTGGGERRVERQSPELLAQTFRGLIASQPIYYLWRRRPKRKQPRPNPS